MRKSVHTIWFQKWTENYLSFASLFTLWKTLLKLQQLFKSALKKQHLVPISAVPISVDAITLPNLPRSYEHWKFKRINTLNSGPYNAMSWAKPFPIRWIFNGILWSHNCMPLKLQSWTLNKQEFISHLIWRHLGKKKKKEIKEPLTNQLCEKQRNHIIAFISLNVSLC